MGFLDKAKDFASGDLASIISPVDAAIVSGDKSQLDPFNIFGLKGADAAQEAAAQQQALGLRGIESIEAAREQQRADLAPFTQFGADAIPQFQQDPGQAFLTDSNSQFDFLQNNPLFQLSLQNANQQTGRGAAAGGRLSAGDTLQQLSNNVLQSAQPLLQQQAGFFGQNSNNLLNAINIGQASAAGTGAGALNSGNQIADLQTQIGNALAAGGVGAANAQAQGVGNAASLAGTIGGLFSISDIRAKDNVEVVGTYKDLDVITWDWKAFVPESWRWGNKGFSAQQVRDKYPQFVSEIHGYLTVNMSGLLNHLRAV